MDEVNKSIDIIQQKKKITDEEKDEIINKLLIIESEISSKEIITGKDQRVFRRIITAFMFMVENHLIKDVLEQVKISPDARITKSAYNYLRHNPPVLG